MAKTAGGGGLAGLIGGGSGAPALHRLRLVGMLLGLEAGGATPREGGTRLQMFVLRLLAALFSPAQLLPALVAVPSRLVPLRKVNRALLALACADNASISYVTSLVDNLAAAAAVEGEAGELGMQLEAVVEAVVAEWERDAAQAEQALMRPFHEMATRWLGDAANEPQLAPFAAMVRRAEPGCSDERAAALFAETVRETAAIKRAQQAHGPRATLSDELQLALHPDAFSRVAERCGLLATDAARFSCPLRPPDVRLRAVLSDHGWLDEQLRDDGSRELRELLGESDELSALFPGGLLPPPPDFTPDPSSNRRRMGTVEFASNLVAQRAPVEEEDVEEEEEEEEEAADDVWHEETFGEKRDRRRSGQWGDASSALSEAAEDQFGLV